MPSDTEIHDAVYALNKDGAPGPDGFGAIFYQTYWRIVKNDVIKAVQDFFTHGKLLNNFNSNTIILIPKDNMQIQSINSDPLLWPTSSSR